MIDATTDSRPPAPEKTGVASLKLVQHRNAPVVQNIRIPKGVHCERHPDTRLERPLTHRPTPAECYGCVDWFQF